jgi:hypothetical protein
MRSLPAMRASRAALALIASLQLMVGAGAAASQEKGPLRAEFWADMAGVPAAGDPYPLPESVAASRLVDEAAYVFAGEVWGFSFEWTPSDKVRKVQESLSFEPERSIAHGDPAMRPEDTRRSGDRLSAYVSFSPGASALALMETYSRSPWRSAQGIGKGDYLKGEAGRRAAYADAARAALRSLMQSLEPNKPRLVRGRMVFAAVPLVGIVDGAYAVQARFRVNVTEVERYELY